MRRALGVTFAVFAASLLLTLGAQAQEGRRSVLPRGTELGLVVVQSRLARAMRPGLPVRLRVANDVFVRGQLVIPAGTLVTGEVRRTYTRGGYYDDVVLSPIRTLGGGFIPLQPLAVRDVFYLGRPLRWRTGSTIGAVVARDVFLSPRDFRSYGRRERMGRDRDRDRDRDRAYDRDRRYDQDRDRSYDRDRYQSQDRGSYRDRDQYQNQDRGAYRDRDDNGY